MKLNLSKIKFSKDTPKNIIRAVVRQLKALVAISSFLFLIFVVLFKSFWQKLCKVPVLGKIKVIEGIYDRTIGKKLKSLIEKMDQKDKHCVKKTYLIRLSIENIKVKKVRSIVTIGGMAVGIGAIVLLVSLGYGLEKLVISKVASLNELKIIDIALGSSTNLQINDDVIAKIKALSGVKEVLPVVSVVGKVSILDSVSEVIAYAVPRSFLEYSEIKKLKGDYFANADSNLSYDAKYPAIGQVAGWQDSFIRAKKNTMVSSERVYFNILPQETVMVWEKCDINSPVLAYTIRTEGGFSGEQWWGSEYFSNDSFGYDGIEEGSGITLGKWIKASFPLYEKDAEGELLPSLLDNGNQKWTDGCITMEKVDITDRIQYKEGQVLGVNTEASASSDLASTNTATGSASTNLVQSDEESTDSAKIQELLKGISGADASSSGDLGWVELEASQSAATPEMMIMEWKKEPTREAMVSSGMLRILGLDLNSAIGKAFKVSFVIVKSLMPSIEGKLSSSETEYKIVGVFEDDTNSYFYIPFSDIRTLGVSNYSQLKLISKNESDTVDIRKKIETMGFQTTSTADTAVEIEKIFGTVRLLLASLGLIALAVAALGMFNTLTVSLLERTREVGVMKAIGMKSEEVKNLFLAEAMIIGISGGVIGLSFGMLFGKLLSLIISIFSIIQKEGFLNLTYTPFFLPHLFLFFPLLSGW